MNARRVWAGVFLATILVSNPAVSSVRSGQVVLKQGDTCGASTVISLNTPFTDGTGHAGFVTVLADGQRAIWWNVGGVFFSSQALPDVLTGGESTMGVSDLGGFIYSPAVNGHDAVYTDRGVLLKQGDAIPSLPGLYSTFNSRPIMLPDATVYWIAGTSETPGGATTNRCLLRASDPGNAATITRVLGGGDVIEGKTIRPGSSNLDYWISDNGQHHIHILDMDATPNEHLYLDGHFVAVEGGDTGQGDHWAHFIQAAVNNDGHYFFSGSTDGDPATDWFLAHDGVIETREGDTLDGVTIPSGSTIAALSVNDGGAAAFIWSGSGAGSWLFCSTGPAPNVAHLVLATGDGLDTDGDSVADYTVTDIIASPVLGPGLDLAEDGRLFALLGLQPSVGGSIRAIVGFEVDLTPSEAPAVLQSLALPVLQCRPDPFGGETAVSYFVNRPSASRLSVLDASGRLVRVLREGVDPAGRHQQRWDGRDLAGRAMPAGTYFLVLDGSEGRFVGKVTRVR